MKILFVCTGNTCRSPMAAALLADAARRRGIPLEVESAGIRPLVGAVAAPEAVRSLAEIGVSLPARPARAIDAEAVRRADLVLCMERRHVERILERHPEAAAKVRLLSEHAGRPEDGDVRDPYGLPIESYAATRDRIRALVEGLLDRLRDGAPAEAAR